MFIQLKSKLASFICNKLLNCCDFQTAKGNRLDSCGRNPFWWLALMQRWKDSLLADLLNSVAGGGSPGFPSDPWIILTTRWVDVWFIAASLANVREKATVGIFISLAYKADFGYCGKSSKNSLNWRYAAWLLHASLVFQRSEIFLNFAPRPSLLPIFSPCPPALIQSPVCCAVDLLHPVTFCREKEGESNAARGARTRQSLSRVLSWGMKTSEIWDQCCMIPRLGMWLPRVQQFILRHAFCFSPPATLFSLTFTAPLKPFLLLCLGLTCFQGSCALSSFLLFLLAPFVNVKMRLGEQIMKHRSAFHTLFRKYSPSEGEMSHFPYFLPSLKASIGPLFYFVLKLECYSLSYSPL